MVRNRGLLGKYLFHGDALDGVSLRLDSLPRPYNVMGPCGLVSLEAGSRTLDAHAIANAFQLV